MKPDADRADEDGLVSERDRHLLLAVDGSAESRKAVRYVAGMVCGGRGFRATLLNVVALPSADYFASDTERDAWIRRRRAEGRQALEHCRDELIAAGFEPDAVMVRVVVRPCVSLAACILDERAQLGCGTVVIARRGISRKEEFLFGSTSSRMLHEARDCTVWVVE